MMNHEKVTFFLPCFPSAIFFVLFILTYFNVILNELLGAPFNLLHSLSLLQHT